MNEEQFNMSLRKFLKHVGVTSQHAIEEFVREQKLGGAGTLKVKMTLTVDGQPLTHSVDGEINLG